MKKLISLLISLMMLVTMMPTVTGIAYGGILGKSSAVCEMNGTKYYTVDSARWAIKNAIQAQELSGNQTIKLLKDIEEDLYFDAEDDITIDLNGHSITNNVSTNKTINNLGTLTLTDTNTDTNLSAHYFNYVEEGAWTPTEEPTPEQIESAVPSYEADSDYPIVVIHGGYITGNGIRNAGTLTIDGANVVGNHHNDGAILNASGTLTVIKSEIVGNTGLEGAGIRNSNGTATVGEPGADNKNVIIAGNTTTHPTAGGYSGGGIASFVYRTSVTDPSTSSLTINSGLIINNKSNYKGGGVSNFVSGENTKGAVASFTMNGGIIEGNTAIHNGAGVSNDRYAQDATAIFTMNGGEIINNKAIYRTASDNGGNGGGVSNTGTFVMTEGDILGNQANLGGGIYNAGTAQISYGEVKSNKAVLSENEPRANGLIGGIYNDKGTLILSNSDVTGNTAATKIGGIFNEGGKLVMIDSTINGNQSPYIGGVAQFGVMLLGGKTIINGNTEKENNGVLTTSSNLIVANLKQLTGCDPVILGNGSDMGGIIVPVLNTDSNIGITYATALDILTYTITKGTGAFAVGIEDYLQSFTADEDNNEVRYASTVPGYLEIAAADKVCKIGSTTYSSIARALLAAHANESTTTPTKITLIRNVTENVEIPNGRNITIDLNGYVLKAKTAGSVITNNGTLNITDSNSESQTHSFTPDDDGLWVPDETNGAQTVTGGVITGGTGTKVGTFTYGGGIYNYGTLTIEGGNIAGNAADRGGAVFMDKVSSPSKLNGGAIKGNTSTNEGAGIYIHSGSELTMDNGTIANNTVINNSKGGGGVYVHGTFIMNKGEISNNKAKSGAGVYVYFYDTTPGVFTMNGGVIKNNTASDKGGGVYVDNNAAVLLCGTITNNTAGNMGGGACLNSPVTVGGNANITANTVKSTANNVTVRKDNKTGYLNLATGTNALTQDARIGVNVMCSVSSNHIVSIADTDNTTNFFSDLSEFSLTVNNNDTTEDTTDDTLELRQNSFYVSNTGDDNGNGTSIAPFKTIGKVISLVGTREVTIELLSDINENVTIYGSQNVKFALNGHKLTGNIQKNGPNAAITYLIRSEADMNNAITVEPANMRQVWDIENDITLNRFVKLSNRYLTINGHDHTITGATGTYSDPDKTLQMFAIDSVNAASKNNVKINNLKLVCSERFKNVLAVQNKDENRNGINLILTNVSIDHSNCRDMGAAILNFGSYIKVYGNFTLETGKNSCYAIGMDLAKKNATLEFDGNAVVSITDNRTSTQKAKRAMIFISSRSSGNEATVCGKYVTSKLVEVKDGETLLGYNLKATPVTPGVYYNPTITVPVSGDKKSVSVSATVVGSNATINDVSKEQIQNVGTADEVVVDLSKLSSNVTGAIIPKTTIENVADSDASGLTIKMPNGVEATFDKTTLGAVASQAAGDKIQFVVDKDNKAEKALTSSQKETLKTLNNVTVLDAYFTSNGKRISDFKGGKVEVLVPYKAKGTGEVKGSFLADDGVKTSVVTKYDAKIEIATLEIWHFSNYILEEVADETSEAELIAAVKNIKIRVNSRYMKWKRTNSIQAYTTVLRGKEELEALKNAGYKVTYDFYRSENTKFNDSQKKFTSASGKYINMRGTKGTRYYFKATLNVYDPEGTLVASTNLAQCKYGTRMFGRAKQY